MAPKISLELSSATPLTLEYMDPDMDFRPIRDRANVVCVECHARKVGCLQPKRVFLMRLRLTWSADYQVKCDLQDSPGEICRNCRRSSIKCM